MSERDYAQELRDFHRVKEISPLGEKVAAIMGIWRGGLHHFPLHDKGIAKVRWDNRDCLEVVIDFTLDTYDFDEMTKLVFLCHDFCVRAEVTPKMNRMSVLFMRRDRKPSIDRYHPRLEDALARYRAERPAPDPTEDDELLVLRRSLRWHKAMLAMLRHVGSPTHREVKMVEYGKRLDDIWKRRIIDNAKLTEPNYLCDKLRITGERWVNVLRGDEPPFLECRTRAIGVLLASYSRCPKPRSTPFWASPVTSKNCSNEVTT